MTPETLISLIRETEETPLLIDRRADGLSGLGGLKTAGLLQRLVRAFEGDKGAAYLEIGVFQGMTLVSSALAAPGLPCFGVDNFAALDPKGENKSIVEDRIARFGAANAILINEDFEAALETLDTRLGGRRVAVYLIDGPHDYRSQMICLLLIKPFLHENAVIVIDDANYPDVRWSTRDFLLGHPEFKLVFDAYSPAHPANMTAAEKPGHEAGWLNGVHVLARDPHGALRTMPPPVHDFERTLFFNESTVRRMRFAELAPEALALADAVLTDGGKTAAEARLRAAHGRDPARFENRFETRNQHSAGLPAGRLNKDP
ncbi:MAG: class I SAM-dependent methyltransferase [Rhodospirillales bacterium]